MRKKNSGKNPRMKTLRNSPLANGGIMQERAKNKGMPNRAQKANGTGVPLASRKFSPEDTPPSGEFSGSLQISHDEARQFQLTFSPFCDKGLSVDQSTHKP